MWEQRELVKRLETENAKLRAQLAAAPKVMADAVKAKLPPRHKSPFKPGPRR